MTTEPIERSSIQRRRPTPPLRIRRTRALTVDDRTGGIDGV
ncbi:hypothetical protein [Natronolimnohabitans innermongolicus]|nr:hypothetical protein [Natronolimnohabitans innermongolicus]